MKNALAALFEVAKELSELAKNSIPKLREGEVIKCEWLRDGIYCRETVFNGTAYQAKFDFKKRIGSISIINSVY